MGLSKPKTPKMQDPAPRVRESLQDQAGAATSQRKKEKKRRGYAATKNPGRNTMFNEGAGNTKLGSGSTMFSNGGY
jgi:hypothetical protein